MREKMKVIKILSVSAVIFIVLLFAAMLINFVMLGRVRSREKQLIAALNEVYQSIDECESEIEYKESEEYIKQLAREELGMKGKGEDAYARKKKK